jgi:hypothetical protein
LTVFVTRFSAGERPLSADPSAPAKDAKQQENSGECVRGRARRAARARSRTGFNATVGGLDDEV